MKISGIFVLVCALLAAVSVDGLKLKRKSNGRMCAIHGPGHRSYKHGHH